MAKSVFKKRHDSQPKDETIHRQSYARGFSYRSSRNQIDFGPDASVYIDRLSDFDSYLYRVSLAFIDDVAVNTELANFHHGGRRSPFIHRVSNARQFLYRLNAFLLLTKISGLLDDHLTRLKF